MSSNFLACSNCGTGQDYKFPENYKSEFLTEGTFCFCSFEDIIIGDTEARIIKLLEDRLSVAMGHAGEPTYWYGMALYEALAEIKGSQNVKDELDNMSEGEDK